MNKEEQTVFQELIKACHHAAMSIHHPACGYRKGNRCSCHVSKAQAALEALEGLKP